MNSTDLKKSTVTSQIIKRSLCFRACCTRFFEQSSSPRGQSKGKTWKWFDPLQVYPQMMLLTHKNEQQKLYYRFMCTRKIYTVYASICTYNVYGITWYTTGQLSIPSANWSIDRPMSSKLKEKTTTMNTKMPKTPSAIRPPPFSERTPSLWRR